MYTCDRCDKLHEREFSLLCEDCELEVEEIEADREWDSYWDTFDHELSEREEWKADDDRERARDMNATLRGGW